MKNINHPLTTFIFAVICLISISSAMAETQDTLSVRQRKIIPIAAFTAMGNMPELEAALIEGMEAGLTVNEIKEILIHSYAYAGFPRALNGIAQYIAVMDKRKAQGINDTTGREATPVPSNFDRTAYGHKVRNALVGRDISKRSTGYPVFTPVIDQFLVDHLFSDIFYRDILSHQDRELTTISILSAIAGTEAQLRGHLGISMNMGLSKSQLNDFVLVLREKVSDESADRANDTLRKVPGIEVSMNQTKSVQVTRKAKPTIASADHFTGKATVESWFASETPDRYRGGVVNFEAGARTAWHTHPLGQTLIVISGSGRVQSEGDAVKEILPGDVVWIPANVNHWHGAATNSPMSHVAISDPIGGKTVEWGEHVNTAP